MTIQKKKIETQAQNGKNILIDLKDKFIDHQAELLASKVEWHYLPGISIEKSEEYPIAICGRGRRSIICIHGFDSSFLEFRRLVPLMENKERMIIPDLFGFGFSPRNEKFNYDTEAIINHLIEVINNFSGSNSVGLIGASMGGAIALELARKLPEKINKLMLLSPAGLSGTPMSIPSPLDKFGVCFLSQKLVRKSLCRQAFAFPNQRVGDAEIQIASAHLKVNGWASSLASFARNGGFANYGLPIPKQPISVICGKKDRILSRKQRDYCQSIFGENMTELENCGHLPHLEEPRIIADLWGKMYRLD